MEYKQINQCATWIIKSLSQYYFIQAYLPSLSALILRVRTFVDLVKSIPPRYCDVKIEGACRQEEYCWYERPWVPPWYEPPLFPRWYEPPSLTWWYEPQSLPPRQIQTSVPFNERTSLPRWHERAYIHWRVYHSSLIPSIWAFVYASMSVLPVLVNMSVRTFLDGWIHTSIHSSLILLILSIWAFVYVWASFDTYIQPFHMSVPSFLLLFWQIRCTSLLSHNTNRVAAHYCCRV